MNYWWGIVAGSLVVACSAQPPRPLATGGDHWVLTGLGDTGDSGSDHDFAGDRTDEPSDTMVAGDPVLTGDDDGGLDWRSSLSVCWTDASCPRVMAIGHGGWWDVSDAPYDSNAAIIAAYEGGMDGVKIDVRVTEDDVPVIAHSSPIEYWESLDCGGDRIEEMTAAEVSACHRFPSTTETFQRLDQVLEYLRGKMVVQLCVKESEDIGRTVDAVRALSAEDFAFIEVEPNDLESVVPTVAGADALYYLVNVEHDLSDVDRVLDVIQNPRAFMIEIEPDEEIGDLTAARLHPAGVRSFTYESSSLASTSHLQDLYSRGYDVVSANTGAEVVAARQAMNQARGVTPP